MPSYPNASGNYMIRTTNLPSLNPLSFNFWFNLNSKNPWSTIINLDDGGSTNYVYMQLDASPGTNMSFYWKLGGGTDSGSFTFLNPSLNTWYFVAVTLTASLFSVWHAAAGATSLTADSTHVPTTGLFTPTRLVYGDSAFLPGDFLDGRTQGYKFWSATFAQADHEMEMHTFRPRTWDNLHEFYPGLSGSTERKRGNYNGYDMTETGTVNDYEPYPPLGWGAPAPRFISFVTPTGNWTNRGRYLLLQSYFRNSTATTFYLALCTNATQPTVDTNTLSQLTEIAAGNGYTAGGTAVARNSTDFDVITEDDTNDRMLIQIKDIDWNASGGAIPASGSLPAYAVLLTDEATVGNRQVIAWWGLMSVVSVSSGNYLRLANCELRITE